MTKLRVHVLIYVGRVMYHVYEILNSKYNSLLEAFSSDQI